MKGLLEDVGGQLEHEQLSARPVGELRMLWQCSGAAPGSRVVGGTTLDRGHNLYKRDIFK